MELLVVVVVIGILAGIGSANFNRMRKNAKMAACISHQRGILEAAVAYAVDTAIPDGVMNVGDLLAVGFVNQNICECPESPVADFDDYNVTWADNFPQDVTCTYRGVLHEYEP